MEGGQLSLLSTSTLYTELFFQNEKIALLRQRYRYSSNTPSTFTFLLAVERLPQKSLGMGLGLVTDPGGLFCSGKCQVGRAGCTTYSRFCMQPSFLLSLKKSGREKAVAGACRMKSPGSSALMHKSVSSGAERYRGLTATLGCSTETNTLL